MKALLGGVGLAVAVAALGVAGEAQGEVTVLGDGQAKACERAAVRGESKPIYEELCSRALETEPLSAHDRAGTYVNRGVFKLRRREWGAAQADFDTALRIMPALGEAWVNRAAASIGQRRFGEGLADVDRGLALGVEAPEKAYFNRALAHEGLGDLKAAYYDYRKAQTLKPDWTAPGTELGRFTVSYR